MPSSVISFWQEYGSDIQSGAVVLSAVTGFLIIASHRKNAKKRNTLDLILHHESDRDLIEARTKFNKLKSGQTKLEIYAAPDHRSKEEAETIRKVLNLHELTAVSIGEGVIDQRVFRRWFNTTYIRDYEATRDYLRVVRETYGNDRLFVEFENTATRWKSDRSWYDKPPWIRRKADAIFNIRRA